MHRHHEDRYIEWGGSWLNLAEYFESALAPPQVDVVLFGGDLGLDLNEELPLESGRGIDRRATGAVLKPRENDTRTLQSWNRLLRRICAAKPQARVAICAGNHDGLLCEDDHCLACLSKRLGRCCDGEWRLAPSKAAHWAREILLSGVEERVRVLTDDHWDFVCANGTPVRVVGSPWTSYDTKGKEHLTANHHWRPKDGFIFGGRNVSEGLCGGRLIDERLNCDEWWRNHWGGIARQLSGVPEGGISLLVTHTPPHGVLDFVGGCNGASAKGRVGDRVLTEMLATLAAPPRLHVFGHVHAMQSRDEPPEGPRLCAAKICKSTLFANVAAERQLPALTGLRLAKQAAVGQKSLVPYAQQGLSAQDYKVDPVQLLMRPPTALVLPVAGWDCDANAAPSWNKAWQRLMNMSDEYVRPLVSTVIHM